MQMPMKSSEGYSEDPPIEGSLSVTSALKQAARGGDSRMNEITAPPGGKRGDMLASNKENTRKAARKSVAWAKDLVVIVLSCWTNTFGKHNRDCYNQVSSK
jgi:hypothetical protein